MFALSAGCWGQSQQNAVVFASPDKNVVLPQGLMVTIKTVALVPSETGGDAVPPGLFLETTLDRRIDGKSCKEGDPISLTLVYPVKFEAGGRTVRVPAPAKVNAHVVLRAPRGKGEPKSRLAFIADSISWDGGQVRLEGVVVAARQAEEMAGDPKAKDLMRAAQEAGGNAREPARSRSHDVSGGVPAPSGKMDPNH